MNRILTAFSYLLVLLSIFTSCQRMSTSYGVVPTPTQGWDIYTAGTYRYGPSIIVNEDGSIDAWLAAEGGKHGKRVSFFEEDTAHTAIQLGKNDIVGQRFEIKEPFYAIVVPCPTWSSKGSALTMTLYQWKGSYEATVKSNPMSSKRFTNIVDNGELMLVNDTKFAAGDYLWTFSNAEGTPGIWFSNIAVKEDNNYWNSEKMERKGAIEAACLLEPSTGILFWDKVAYRRSTDGGKTWTPDTFVLYPTEGGRDQYSTCDPGVVKHGEYYYLGYTSTDDLTMMNNDLYICRSKSPTGPWEKWNGNGWGGLPQPIIEFTGNPNKFGVGEASMVVVKDTLYLYYSWNDEGDEETTTRVATAPVNEENWPKLLVQKGTALNKTAIANADHADVKYRPDLGKFYAIHTASRFSEQSHLLLWESVDGIRFEQVARIDTLLKTHLHNCGWGGNPQGHILPDKPTYVGYAYGTGWGKWNTHWHLLQF